MITINDDITKAPPTFSSPFPPMEIEVGVNFEKLCLRMLRGGSAQAHSQSLITTSIELLGLGAQAKFGAEVLIQGHLEGAKVTDSTPEGSKYSNILSVGSCREGRDIDMVTSMVTSYYLKNVSDCVSFEVRRAQNKQSPNGGGPRPLSSVHLSLNIPSILYVHSVNFVSQMELFASEFMEYFDAMRNTVKTAALDMAKGLVRERSQIADTLNMLSTSLAGGQVLTRGHSQDDEGAEEEDNEGEEPEGGGGAEETDTSIPLRGGVDRLHIDFLVKSPVVVLPSTLTGSNCLVAHLGEISVKNSFTMVDQIECITGKFALSCSEVEHVLLKITNMTLHATHDQGSLDWLVSEIQDECPSVSGRWSKVLKETSFVLDIQRALSISGSGDTTPTSDHASPKSNASGSDVVDVLINCSIPNSLHLLFTKEVFDQVKCTAKNGIYKPLGDAKYSKTTPTHSVTTPKLSEGRGKDEGLPRISASFSLPRLSIQLKHTVGTKQKDLVYISFEDFSAQCQKSTPYIANFDLSLRTVIIEDLMQSVDSFRYILSSTPKPLPFPSPVATPSSLYSRGMGISPRQFLPLNLIISSPKPPRPSFSPLRSFNPFLTPGSHGAEETPTKSTTPPSCDASSSSSVTDVQDLVSIGAELVLQEHPLYSTKYNNIGAHVSVHFSSVFLVINLQTWVLLFDYLGIGVPTPPPSPASKDTPTFNLEPPQSPDDSLDKLSLRSDGSVFIKEKTRVSFASDAATPTVGSPTKEGNLPSKGDSVVWGAEDKVNAHVTVEVQSLTVTFNKLEHPLARGVASGLKVDVTLTHGNIRVLGSLGQASLVDLTDTGTFYRERLITSGDQALTFDVFKLVS